VSDFFERVFGSTSTKGSDFNQVNSSDYSSKKSKTTLPRKGKNFTTELKLSLEDAFKGTSRILNVNGQRIEVKFKPGIADGQTQKISERGYPSTNPDGKPGDLIIKIKVNEDPKVERKGNDLYSEAECDLYTAILGGTISTSTFFGSFSIKVPPNSQNGKLFKLSGQGMPLYNSDSKERGSLFVKLTVELPSNLTTAEIELFTKLKKLRS